MKTRRKTSAVVAGVAALAIAGGFAATFTTSNTAPAQNIGSGTLALALDNVAPTVWTDSIANLAAGDSISRYLDVRNSGSLKMSSLSLSQTNTLGALLTSPSDIAITIDSCSVAWTQADGTCSGTLLSSLPSQSVASWGTAAKSLGTFDAFGAGEVRHLRVSTTLAQGAPNAAQGANGTITYTFAGSQRAAGTDTGAGVSNATVAVTQPTNVSATASGSNINVAWTDTNAGQAAYTVTYSASGVPSTSVPLPAGSTSYTLANAKPNTAYSFGVVATAGAQAAPVASSAPVTVAPAVWSDTAMATDGAKSRGSTAVGTDGTVYYIAGNGGYRKYNPTTNAWAAAGSWNYPWEGTSAATAKDGKVYVFGGVTQGAVYGGSAVYNPATNSYGVAAGAPVARMESGAATGGDGNIYLVGGSNTLTSANVTNGMYRFNPTAGTWSTMAAMPTARGQVALVPDATGENLYAIGGLNGANAALNTVQKYNIAANTWTTVASMPTARSYAGATLGADGMIYVAGGSTNTTASGATAVVEKYDPTTNTWSAAPSMKSARYQPGMVTGTDGRIYVLGGMNSSGSGVVSNERFG